jgi:hypothetical protein
MNIHVQFGFNNNCRIVVSGKKAFEHFPIGSNVNLCIAVAAMAATAGLSLTLHPMGKMFENATSLKPLRQ